VDLKYGIPGLKLFKTLYESAGGDIVADISDKYQPLYSVLFFIRDYDAH
jgi:hypothetical protein